MTSLVADLNNSGTLCANVNPIRQPRRMTYTGSVVIIEADTFVQDKANALRGKRLTDMFTPKVLLMQFFIVCCSGKHLELSRIRCGGFYLTGTPILKYALDGTIH